METVPSTFIQIRSILDQLRNDPKSKRCFPQKIWNSIIQLTEAYPLNFVCQNLNINPVYLRRKIKQSKKSTFEFQELTFSTSCPSCDIVKIELASSDGLKATIQGPISCLDCVYKLFKG